MPAVPPQPAPVAPWHSAPALAAAWLVALAMTAAVGVALGRGRARARDADAHPGPWRLALVRLRRDRAAMLALRLLTALVVLAAGAHWLAPYDPNAVLGVEWQERPPSHAHPFGTDLESRDVLSRVLYGARVSLGVALLATAIAATLGTAYGTLAGYYDRRLGAPMMRLIDAALAIPTILLLLAVVALWDGVSLPALILLLGLTGWFGVSRLVRAQVLAERTREHVLAARALGAGDGRILWRHILPNVLSPVIVAATLGVGNVVIVEAGLSYLSAGVHPPTASWGNIILDASGDIPGRWWLSLFPGLAIVLTVMAVNTVGDGLRDALDPRGGDG